MHKSILVTADGSHTLAFAGANVTYHSIHGAIQESMHVFIAQGLAYSSVQMQQQIPLRIFEMGFGTGLNALLSAQYALTYHMPIHYTAVELFPLEREIAIQLNYPEHFEDPFKEIFYHLHESDWEKNVMIAPLFTLYKTQASLLQFKIEDKFHLIYFDAFAPKVQPELWTLEIFEKMYDILETNGALVTYCSKGDVRRSLIAAGFEVEKLPGPPRKREMLRAIKK